MVSVNYNKTKRACYLGFVTQAIVANFTPLLFLIFHREYKIAISSLALIPATFYVVQLLTDLLCAKFRNIDYRKSIIVSEVTAALGLIGLAFVPQLFDDKIVGILLCVCVYSVGSGLIEVLCSPIIEACPFPDKEGMMSMLHSFYCWGAVGVIMGSTLFFMLFGQENWWILSCLWALIPLYNIVNFATCPIEPIVKDAESMTMTQLLKSGTFWVFLVLMVAAVPDGIAGPLAHRGFRGLHGQRSVCGHHVARLHQSHLRPHARGRHGHVRAAGTGWRHGGHLGSLARWRLHRNLREQHPGRTARRIHIPRAVGGVPGDGTAKSTAPRFPANSLAASAAPAADGRRRREALVAGAPDHERVEDGQERAGPGPRE